ncbi:MAG: YajQ family cyclic di-GMP-binding protein [Campylobacteraceae bacterium]|nr:YajQ family cyclic di-GMP-binding protein [Campylobacteraceae bacterium]
MAKEHSFDVTAEVDKQELKNAIEQAKKEISARYDFKGVNAEIEYLEKAKAITLLTSSDAKADAMKDIVISRVIKRGIPAQAISELKREEVGGKNTKVTLQLIDSIGSEDAKKIVKEIKALKLKVQATIRGDELRIVGKSRDDLQESMRAIKEMNLELPLSFTNLS